MKNIILLAGAILFVGSIASCKKDYTCKCTKTYTTGSGSTTQNYSIYTYTDTRKKADDRCDANAATGSDLGGDYSINCAIQ